MYKVQAFDLESNEAKYYFKWLYSQGNKDGLKLIDAIKTLTKNPRKKISVSQNLLKTTKTLEVSLPETFQYLKRVDNTTWEWIKKQPYLTNVQKINDDAGDSTYEQYSMSYLKLIG